VGRSWVPCERGGWRVPLQQAARTILLLLLLLLLLTWGCTKWCRVALGTMPAASMQSRMRWYLVGGERAGQASQRSGQGIDPSRGG